MAVKVEKNKNELGGYLIILFIVLLIIGAILAGQLFKSEGKLQLHLKMA